MRKSPYYRNQRGMAMWLKMLLCIFALLLLGGVIASICLNSYMKDMTDPIKTEAVANQIAKMKQPLPPPFEYGPMNVSMFGLTFALVKNSGTGAMYFVGKCQKKSADQNAKVMVEGVAKGECGLPDPSQGPTGNDGSGSKSNMSVETQGELPCGGKTLYYVLGKSVVKINQSSGKGQDGKGQAAAELSTFLGAADSNDPQSLNIFIGRQPDPAKPLTLEEVKDFLSTVEAI